MYPYTILYNEVAPFPILENQYHWEPYIFDFIEPYYLDMPVRDTEYMNTHNMTLLRESGKSWWIGWYLDDRSYKLKGTHIYNEGRVFHLGIDIMTQGIASIYNPLVGKVYEVNYEDWHWGYWGYVIMEYSFSDRKFFALFGHMDYKSLPWKGSIIQAGEKLWTLGTSEQNWNWVPHLHLQVFTGVDFEKWKLKGYCALEDMKSMQYICPHPWFLLRWFPS